MQTTQKGGAAQKGDVEIPYQWALNHRQWIRRGQPRELATPRADEWESAVFRLNHQGLLPRTAEELVELIGAKVLIEDEIIPYLTRRVIPDEVRGTDSSPDYYPDTLWVTLQGVTCYTELSYSWELSAAYSSVACMPPAGGQEEEGQAAAGDAGDAGDTGDVGAGEVGLGVSSWDSKLGQSLLHACTRSSPRK